jgi:uncharacterized membrane protein YeaQ/YmgE (transglycosylase-associated protein family)
MSIVDFLILILIAGICGAVGRAIAGSRRGGMLVAIALGFIGALFGMFLSRKLGLPELLSVAGFPIVWSIIGAALFVAVLTLLTKPRP